jgi:hypothetical protein
MGGPWAKHKRKRQVTATNVPLWITRAPTPFRLGKKNSGRPLRRDYLSFWPENKPRENIDNLKGEQIHPKVGAMRAALVSSEGDANPSCHHGSNKDMSTKLAGLGSFRSSLRVSTQA